MISIDSVETITTKRQVPRVKGRLVRSLEFTDYTAIKRSKTTTGRRCRTKSTTKSSISIWRDPLKNVLPPSKGFTTHKMSSITNNFVSSDLKSIDYSSSSSEIDEMVEDLVDPGSGTLVFPQHDDVFRSSPLSSSSFIAQIEELDEFDLDPNVSTNEASHNFEQVTYQNSNENNFGMSWNPKENKWVPLIYRYVFPSSSFDISTTVSRCSDSVNKTKWSFKNGQITMNPPNPSTATFSFPPPQKSIMMGPVKLDSDARDVCEKLLELIDDENLMLPVVKSSHPVSSESPQKQHQLVSSATTATATGNKTLLSEWSSLPSSPPPPIFHDVCNRPIPELRLSPPMTGKSIGKRLFPVTSVVTTKTSSNSPCESPLTKRLGFSSSSSSIA